MKNNFNMTLILIKYSFIFQCIKKLFYKFIDLFNFYYLNSKIKYPSKKISIIGNGPSISKYCLPKNNVIICNHFWIHSHYLKITEGFHIISDRRFLQAKNINKFFKNINNNLTIITTHYVRKKLLENKVYGPVIIPINYSSAFQIWENKNFIKKSIFNKICYTGSTVVADIGFPLVKYLNCNYLNIYGVDLNYGKSLKSYAFSSKGLKLADDYFMETIWKERAPKSIKLWINYLKFCNVKIKWFK